MEGTTWYRGDYALPDDALSQLRRAVGKLVRLKRVVSFVFEVSGKLVFPHEEFRLSGGKEALFQHLVLRYDMRIYFRSFENKYSGASASELEDVIERHIVPNPYFKLRIEFDMVRHGLYCGSRESNETHLVRAISVFKYLFGNLKMTSRRMMEFTGNAVNVRTLQKILNKYYDFTEAMKKSKIPVNIKIILTDKIFIGFVGHRGFDSVRQNPILLTSHPKIMIKYKRNKQNTRKSNFKNNNTERGNRRCQLTGSRGIWRRPAARLKRV